ncbi:MAG: hypothetical protein OXC18_22345 [Desulfurellaceae bacterium]|nr:hypothetical protein [Desulfurellaceae bacterium]
MTDKTDHPHNSGQLGFAFFSAASEATTPRQGNGRRTQASLATLLPHFQTAFLETPLDEVDRELVPLLEMCESVLTRALDVARKRGDQGWSEAEYRSLRGIGQAQWLLIEAQAKKR